MFSGLIVGTSYKHGQNVIENREFDKDIFADYLRQTLEVARRHKIMNPEKMRSEYGKLVYLLQAKFQNVISKT